MMRNRLHTYGTWFADGATHIDLLIATYDGLAEDIRLAGAAARSGDVQARCRHSEHALLLLGHAESWVAFLADDSNLQQILVGFYAYLRSRLLQLQGTKDHEAFEALAMHVCEARAAWQQKQDHMLRAQAVQPAVAIEKAICSGEGRFCCSA